MTSNNEEVYKNFIVSYLYFLTQFMTQLRQNVDDKSKSMSKSFYSVTLNEKTSFLVEIGMSNSSPIIIRCFPSISFFIQSKINVLEKFESNTKGKLTTTTYLTRGSFPHGLNVY